MISLCLFGGICCDISVWLWFKCFLFRWIFVFIGKIRIMNFSSVCGSSVMLMVLELE